MQAHNMQVVDRDSYVVAQVTDYLKKKGFTKTEAIFRQETAYLGPDGRPAQRNDDPGPKKYLKAFVLLKNWIENNLDIYKVGRYPMRGSYGY
jgi:transcription initiation factor TFIID subunit 5